MELVIQYSRLFTSRHKSRSIGVFRFQFLVSDSWSLVPGFWFLVPGFWFLVSGSWFLVPGSWFLVSGFWFPVPGFLLWYPSQPVWNGTCNTIFEVVHIQAQKQKFLAAQEFLVFSSWFLVPGFWFLVSCFWFLVFDFDTPHSHCGLELVIQYSRSFTSRHKSRSFLKQEPSICFWHAHQRTLWVTTSYSNGKEFVFLSKNNNLHRYLSYYWPPFPYYSWYLVLCTGYSK